MRAGPFLALCLPLFACPGPTGPSDAGVRDAGPVDAGCAPGTLRDAAGQCITAGARCGNGFTTDDSGFGCLATLERCEAGAMAFPGQACTPVGWRQCPEGFARTDDGWSCEPVLPAAACTGANRAALGSTTCVPVGDCAAAFPPADATLFVDAALPQEDATHFKSLTAALTAAPAGATIAVAAGSYSESLTVTRAVSLVGRCAAQVQLTGSPAIFVDGASGVTLSGLTLHDSVLALRVEHAAQVTLRDAVLDHNERSAVQVLDEGTEVLLERVVVRDTQPDATTATFGQGVAASYGAGLTLRDVQLTGNREAALFLDRANTHATLLRVLIASTAARASTGTLGWGLGAQRGASFTAREVVIDDSTTGGLVLSGAPSTATLTDVVVRRTHQGIDNAGNATALGVSLTAGATATWTGGESSEGPGILVQLSGAGTSLTVADVTLRHGTDSALATAGFSAEDGAALSLSDVAVLGSAGDAARELGARLTVSRLYVRDTAGGGVAAQGGRAEVTGLQVDGHADLGARVLEHGTLTLSGCDVARGTSSRAEGLGAQTGVLLAENFLVRDAVAAGVYAREAGTSMVLANGRVEGTRLDDAGEFGQGVIVEAGASVSLTDVSLEGNHSAGLQSADLHSVLDVERVLVRGTLPNATGTRGRGANANFDGALSSRGGVFLDNQQVGVFAFQSVVTLTDTFVVGVKPDPDGAYGNGVEALTDGSIVMTGGGVAGCAGIAAVFAEGAGVLDGVRVASNEVGLHAQDGSNVEERDDVPSPLGARQVVVTSRTAFEDNVAKLSSTTVPVPPL